MKKLFSRVNKKFVAIFFPLSLAYLLIGGAKPMWFIVLALGIGCVIHDMVRVQN